MPPFGDGADRLSRLALPERPAELGLEDELALLGSAVAGPRALSRFAATAAANTDDRPIVACTAPRATYAPDSTPRGRLIALLRELSIEPGELVLPPPIGPREIASPPTGRAAR
jgi:spermidine synthase